MKTLVLSLLFAIVCSGCTDTMKLYKLKFKISQIQCNEPQLININYLNDELYIGDKFNVKVFTDNTIILSDYIFRLENSNNCYRESIQKIKEEK